MRKTSTNKAKGKKNRPKTKLGIPDLEHSKAAALRSLGSPDSRRGYQHADPTDPFSVADRGARDRRWRAVPLYVRALIDAVVRGSLVSRQRLARGG